MHLDKNKDKPLGIRRLPSVLLRNTAVQKCNSIEIGSTLFTSKADQKTSLTENPLLMQRPHSEINPIIRRLYSLCIPFAADPLHKHLSYKQAVQLTYFLTLCLRVKQLKLSLLALNP